MKSSQSWTRPTPQIEKSIPPRLRSVGVFFIFRSSSSCWIKSFKSKSPSCVFFLLRRRHTLAYIQRPSHNRAPRPLQFVFIHGKQRPRRHNASNTRAFGMLVPARKSSRSSAQLVLSIKYVLYFPCFTLNSFAPWRASARRIRFSAVPAAPTARSPSENRLYWLSRALHLPRKAAAHNQ